MTTEKIWFNGEIVEEDKAKVGIRSRSLHYGFGVFEGIRYYKTDSEGPVIFRLRDHIQRFFDSAEMHEWYIPFFKAHIWQACIDVVRANKLEEGYIRPLMFVDEGDKKGLEAIDSKDIKVAIMVWLWESYLGKEEVVKGIRLKISSFRKVPGGLMFKSKTSGNYILSYDARQEANNSGFNEALLLDQNGFVAEGTAENIFFVKKGEIVTPPPSAPILMGITRDSIMKIARREGYGNVVERNFTVEELFIADEVFLTGTAAEITPVREVDGRLIGMGKPGPITLKIQEKLFDIVHGKSKDYKDWLTYADKEGL